LQQCEQFRIGIMIAALIDYCWLNSIVYPLIDMEATNKMLAAQVAASE
jgi:hypothetical protein